MKGNSDKFHTVREQHYERFFGPLDQFAPTRKRPYWTLITGGMSDLRQIEPKDCDEYQSPTAEILAIQLEERDLVRALPEYESYRRRVPMLIPFTR